MAMCRRSFIPFKCKTLTRSPDLSGRRFLVTERQGLPCNGSNRKMKRAAPLLLRYTTHHPPLALRFARSSGARGDLEAE